eukprot:gene5296-23071_t
MYVFYPSNASAGEKFPLISYAHGMLAGYLGVLYRTLFPQLASYGFVVAAPAGCNSACTDQVNAPYTDCAGLPPVSPARWPSYYGEQLEAARHTPGHQGTFTERATRWGIKAAVLHHAADGDTSLEENLPSETRDIYENSPVHPKVFREEVGWAHEEPMCGP